MSHHQLQSSILAEALSLSQRINSKYWKNENIENHKIFLKKNPKKP